MPVELTPWIKRDDELPLSLVLLPLLLLESEPPSDPLFELLFEAAVELVCEADVVVAPAVIFVPVASEDARTVSSSVISTVLFVPAALV